MINQNLITKYCVWAISVVFIACATMNTVSVLLTIHTPFCNLQRTHQTFCFMCFNQDNHTYAWTYRTSA